MPKNAHPPRGNATSSSGKKKAAPTNGAPEGGEYIVFGDGPKKPRNNKRPNIISNGAAGNSKAAESAKEKAEVPEGAAEEPKKPSTREIIGGASWTGKLPMTLLSEHCQKQKWDKPEYTMAKNTKTHELVTLAPFKLPPTHKHIAVQPSALEARHFAAAYALFRISSMKNIHMMMPPAYRDLWKGDFTDLKKEDVANGKDFLYAADPFQNLKEREEAQAQKAKKLEIRAKEQAAREKEAGPGLAIAGGPVKDFMKGWKTAPKMEMGKKTRRDVESLIRNSASWNPNGVQIPGHQRSKIQGELSNLGFRLSHVQEATALCKDREEVLEWLLIHVPEDDLPKWALPEGYTAGVSMASGNLKREGAIKRLAAAGYAVELCEEAFDQHASDETKAAVSLQDTLLGDLAKEKSDTWTDDADSVWKEELEVLTSIFETRFELLAGNACKIRLETKTSGHPIDAIFHPHPEYPQNPPVLFILAPIPAYIRLAITRQALQHVISECLGDQMVFNLIDWLEREIPTIIKNPGRLADVSAASSAVAAPAETTASARIGTKRKRHPVPLEANPGGSASLQILSSWEKRQTSPQQQKMLNGRRTLPAWELQEAISNAVRSHQVVIVSGETGSGKSTQSVQFVLDDMIKRQLGDAVNIVCTQPRRISALGLADRVADERCSAVGQEVGYTIRGESKTSAQTKLTFVTTGVLLRRLQTSGGSTEDVVRSLADISHVVVDEVHERSLDTDFLLALLRDVCQKRKDLRVILMSATLDAAVFERYFGGKKNVATIEIQGRTYPVTDYYLDDVVRATGHSGRGLNLEDEQTEEQSMGSAIQSLGMGINYELIASLVRHIDSTLGDQDGGILIFLPGTMEISRTLDALRSVPNLHALPLHASLLPAEQRRVFPAAPRGMRKVIAATNVAETSITISDIVAVIDSGRVKETRYDPITKMVKLEEVWTSRAAGKQRRGRAGRVRAGNCYKLYTRQAEQTKMAERPEPEIRRVPLEQLCLSVKAMGVPDVPSFLSNTLTPPDTVAVGAALTFLRQVGALDAAGDILTALGQHMAMIPADLRCAKLMVYGALFGCLDASVTIASILTVRSPFISPKDRRDEAKAAREAFTPNNQPWGDIITDLRAHEAYAEQRRSGTRQSDIRAWCDRNFLSPHTLADISTTRTQYLTSLKEIGFLPLAAHHEHANRHATSLPLLAALISAALSPQTLRIQRPAQKYSATAAGAMALDPAAREIRFFDAAGQRTFVHPSSTLFAAQAFPAAAGAFLSYWQRVATSRVFARELAPAGVMALCLFGGGGALELDTAGRGLVVGHGGGGEGEAATEGWRVRGWARIGVLVGRLRGCLDRVLEGWIEQPSAGRQSSLEEERLVNLVRRLVELEGLDS
ncbi:hypothetical protein FH972_022807 [Carpinus fangiana]|uniref:RNA helicase n=1 Tax=Carpinus fangiana TaxID=176857 RepID=A0A5N6KTC4_9ROSI|nr:hypothetical protein FH972_022807 [Carpinus fangiana]